MSPVQGRHGRHFLLAKDAIDPEATWRTFIAE
jgi:hypothetical protein